MQRNHLVKIGFALLSGFIFMMGCRKRDVPLPDALVNFETTSLGMSSTENSIVIKLKLSRATDKDIAAVVAVTEQGVTDGTDYSITPAATSGKINLTIPSGNNEVSFTLTKKAGVLFDGDEKLLFEIYSSGSPVLIGVTKQLALNFAEIVATGNSAVINGGGATFPNKVFIELSSNRQTTALRSSWDLGFYTGSDDYRVILNSSLNMMVKQINKNDLNTVTANDTVGFSAEVAFSQAAPSPSQLPYIDYPDGDLTKSAIASIAATATDNKVYIVNRGNGAGNPAPSRGWKKIRIIRNGNGYTLQHADIAATSFSSVDIQKDDAYFFKHISFEGGAINIEPQKKKWDLAWTYFANVTNFGGGEVPYMFQDIILLNRNVQVAKVMNTVIAFENFTETGLTSQTFLATQHAIATDWRSGGGPGTQPAVRTDRYYIIKDSDNNFYKLRFTALTQNGERGYPAYETVLVKRGG